MRTSSPEKQKKPEVLVITNSGVFVESEDCLVKVNISSCSKCVFKRLCGYQR